MHKYRVFISYSHEDQELANTLVELLEKIDVYPIWDKDLRPGYKFSEALKHGIAHAHVFLPLLTKVSVKRPWVHQETGYAIGMGIPLLPVAIGQVPKAFTKEIQALVVQDMLENLCKDTLAKAIEELLDGEYKQSETMYRYAALPEQRAEFLAQYTCDAIKHHAEGPLRQSGALTSFCLPNEPPEHGIWRLRDQPNPRSQYYYELLHEERTSFEDYARKHGCKLIIAPYLPKKQDDEPDAITPDAIRIRLDTLLRFLKDTTVINVQVAVYPHLQSRNLTIVGDWFCADTRNPKPGKGYHQTIFTWHAPTVLRMARDFDKEFEMLGGNVESSRERAIEAVEKAIASI